MLIKQSIPQIDLKNILDKYQIGEVSKTEPLSTSGNLSQLVTTTQGVYFLRLCPDGPRHREVSEIAAEIELLEYLAGHHFPVILPISSRSGEKAISWKNHNGYLRPYIDDQYIADPSMDQIFQFGSLLGWFHCLTENYQTPQIRKHIFNAEETLKHFQSNKHLILNSCFNQADKFVKRVEELFVKLKFPADLPSGMIHEDLGKRHVLWHDSKITAIIDFDRSYFGPLILDLGQSLRGWCFVDDWTSWSNPNCQSLLRGYLESRQLQPNEISALVPAIKFALLERGISFALRYIEVTQDPEDEWFARQSVFDFQEIIDQNQSKIMEVISQ